MIVHLLLNTDFHILLLYLTYGSENLSSNTPVEPLRFLATIKVMMKNRRYVKSIPDVSWGEFVRQVKYKASWKGVIVAQIGRFDPSSKLCSTDGCSYKNTNLKLG